MSQQPTPAVRTGAKNNKVVFRARLLPFQVPVDLKQPEARDVGNKFVVGRPRIDHLDSSWPLPTGSSKVPVFLPPQALQNRTGVCYRNAIVQCLMNSPIFVNWLTMHVSCPRRDCLVCSFSKLARWYFNNNSQQQPPPPRQTLFTPLDEFWDLCKKVFWGPRAQKKKGVGPIDPDAGGVCHSFLLWLIRAMQDQCENEPSDLQLLERMFSIQYKTFATCHNLNGPNGKCQFRSSELYRQEMESLVMRNEPGAAASTADKAIDHGLREVGYGKGKFCCPDCDSDAHLRQDVELVNAPEVFIVIINRPSSDKTIFWNDIKLTESLLMTNYTSDKSPLVYKLAAIAAWPGDRFGLDRQHIVSMVHARDNHWYRVDNNKVARLPSLQAVDDLQRSPIPEKDRFMPHILFYTRAADTDDQIDKLGTKRNFTRTTFDLSAGMPPKRLKRSPSPVGSAVNAIQDMSLRDISDLPTRQKVNDLIACFPDFSRAELFEMLTQHGGSIHRTVESIHYGAKDPDITLDDVPYGYRSNTTRAHLLLPYIPVQEIYDTLRRNPFNFKKAIRELQLRPSIDLGFTEKVADASFTTRLTLAPPDLRIDKEVRRLAGSVKYEIAGEIWGGSFVGHARLLSGT